MIQHPDAQFQHGLTMRQMKMGLKDQSGFLQYYVVQFNIAKKTI